MANASLRVRTSFRGTRGLAASPGITLSPTPTHRRHPHLDPATMSNPLESLCSSWCVATQQRRGVEWCGLARVVSVVWNKKQDTSLPRQQMSMPHCMRCRCTSGAPNHCEGRPSKQSQFSHTHFVSQFLFRRCSEPTVLHARTFCVVGGDHSHGRSTEDNLLIRERKGAAVVLATSAGGEGGGGGEPQRKFKTCDVWVQILHFDLTFIAGWS